MRHGYLVYLVLYLRNTKYVLTNYNLLHVYNPFLISYK